MLRRIVFLLSLLLYAWVARGQNTAAYPSSAVTDSTLTLASDDKETTLSSGTSIGASTLPVASTTGFKVPVLLWIDTEEFKCLTKTSNSFTSCTAGFDGTTQAAHLSAATVSNFVSAYLHNQVVAEIEAIESDLITGLPAVRGGTGQTSPTDDAVLLGNGSLWQQKVIADCTDTGGNHLNYTAATNSFSCGTSGGGSSTTFQVNGTGLTSSSTVNFLDSSAFNGLTLTFTNPSAGGVKLGVSGTLGNAGLTNSATTVNGQTCTLGSTCTVTAAPNQTATDKNLLIANGSIWQSVALSGDASVTNAGVWTNSKLNGTSVPTNSAADQLLGTTASATGSWISLINCIDSAGNHLNYTVSTHIFSCGTTTSGGSAPTAINTGTSATDPYGPIFQFTDPTSPSYSWVNQGSATVTTTGKGITLFAPTNASTSWNMRVITAPSTPYSITISFIETTGPTTGSIFVYSGLVIRDSGSSKFESCATISLGAGIPETVVSKWTNSTTFSAHYTGPSLTSMPAVQWLKIVDTGTNITCNISSDGLNFVQIHTIGRTDFMTTPDQVGFATNNQNTAKDSYMNILSWKQGTT